MTQIVEIHNNHKRYVGSLIKKDQKRMSVHLLNPDLVLQLTWNEFVRAWIFPNGEMVDRVQIYPATIDNFKHSDGFVLPMFRFASHSHTTSHSQTTNSTNNKKTRLVCLLGRETEGSDRGTYDSFGGRRDILAGGRTETPLQTAAREFWEEGLLKESLNASLQSTIESVKHGEPICVFDGRLGHVLYFKLFPFNEMVDYMAKYIKTARHLTRSGKRIEKDNLAVVYFDDLWATASRATTNSCHAIVWHLDGRITSSKIRVRTILLKILKEYIISPIIKSAGVRFCST
jgi:hypothetical protein